MESDFPRVAGTVEWWSDGEGSVCPTAAEAPGGVFVHFSNIVSEGYRSLVPGESVEFGLEPYPHGLCARLDVEIEDGGPLRARRCVP